jgi:proteasome accessory factor C
VVRPTAGDRLARLLAVVPWVVEHPGVALTEVAERFGVTPKELVADFQTLSMVGVYPYTPDALVEATVEDGEVWVRYADWFERPLRLTPGEALALVVAGRGLLAAPGADAEGPLARGLTKLEEALRLRGVASVDVDLGEDAPGLVPTLRQAVDEHAQVELDHWSVAQDAVITRTVDPYAVAAEAGRWYLRGFDHLRGEERVFRLDRIRAVRPTAERFDPPPRSVDVRVYEPGPDDPRVTLDLPPESRWVVEAHPHEQVEVHEDGSVQVVLPVSSTRWLAGLLLRLGPRAVVAGTTGGLDVDALRRDAADRVLARYGR